MVPAYSHDLDISIIHAQLFYNGHRWSPERLMLQALVDESQKDAEGFIRISAKQAATFEVTNDGSGSP